jgi:hypothetical protein
MKLQMENGDPFIGCKRKTETANFRLFASNENGKLTFICPDLLTINGNQRLLFQHARLYT